MSFHLPIGKTVLVNVKCCCCYYRFVVAFSFLTFSMPLFFSFSILENVQCLGLFSDNNSFLLFIYLIIIFLLNPFVYKMSEHIIFHEDKISYSTGRKLFSFCRKHCWKLILLHWLIAVDEPRMLWYDIHIYMSLGDKIHTIATVL